MEIEGNGGDPDDGTGVAFGVGPIQVDDERDTATQTVDATNAAALAVDWALAQVGTPYIGAEKRRALDSTAPGSSKPPTAPPASPCPASPKTNTTPGRGSRPMKKL